MQMIEAQVIDANHLKLLYPLQLRPHSKVMVTILSAEESENEDDLWFQLAKERLAAGYSDDDPDYPTELLKYPNNDVYIPSCRLFLLL